MLTAIHCAVIFTFCPHYRVSVVGQKFKGQTKLSEPWYGTEYSLEKIPEETLQVRIAQKSSFSSQIEESYRIMSSAAD